MKALAAIKLVIGLPSFQNSTVSEVCSACQIGKQHRRPFAPQGKKSSRILELIHTDIWTASTTSLSGCMYFVSFIDDFSRKTWIYTLKNKSEAYQAFRNFKSLVEKQTNLSIQRLRCDGGGEYFSGEFIEYLQEQGIQRETTCRYTPQQNGVAERKNRHIAETARAMLNEMYMPNSYWAEAVMCGVHLMNCTPTAAAHNATPEEIFLGKKPNFYLFKVFGCVCYVHIPNELCKKLDPKSQKCIFLGYAAEYKGYRCYNPSTKQFFISRDVVFDERKSWYPQPASQGPILVRPTHTGQVQHPHADPSSSVISGVTDSTSDQGGVSSASTSSPWSPQQQIDGSSSMSPVVSRISDAHSHAGSEGRSSVTGMSDLRRSERVRYPVQRLMHEGFVAAHHAYMVNVLQEAEPTSVEEALHSSEWVQAMEEELSALELQKTWTLVDLPHGKNAIGCRWVYKIKHNADGTVNRYKARLAAKGYAQEYGLDYEETFSPVAKMATIRVVAAIAVHRGWKLHQMDFSNAFLNGDLIEEVYMMQPPGYENTLFPNRVCRLDKALYGLKQAPRAWYNKITGFLGRLGFVVCTSDSSLYILRHSGHTILLTLYVDDLILTGSSEEIVQQIKLALQAEFRMKDLGELKYFLGVEFVRSSDSLWLLQRQYALDVLSRFGMTACKPAQTPLEQNLKLTPDDGELIADSNMYRKMVGSLIYLTITRPDLSYSVGVISQFMQSPRKPHLDAVCRILRYVKGTIMFGLHYFMTSQFDLHGYRDADWSGCVYD